MEHQCLGGVGGMLYQEMFLRWHWRSSFAAYKLTTGNMGTLTDRRMPSHLNETLHVYTCMSNSKFTCTHVH